MELAGPFKLGLDLNRNVYVFCPKEQGWFTFSAYDMEVDGYEALMKFVPVEKPPILAYRSAILGSGLNDINIVHTEVQALFKRTFITQQDMDSISELMEQC